jgi:hypothetical protein
MSRQLAFVTCANNPELLSRCLLTSPCLVASTYQQTVYLHAASAAEAFNREIARQRQAMWLVWVHQDVVLPEGWDHRFIAAVAEAELAFPKLAVVGAYGVAGAGQYAQRAGHLLDRGTLLRESAELPCRVDSIDELLFAVRTDSGLQLDPALGFDFYGTDLVLTAKGQGFDVAVVDAYCEHWSTTPKGVNISSTLQSRVTASGNIFEQKWADHLPLDTPCFTIVKRGDVENQCRIFAGESL